ncbi:MAG TPA: PDZ domain-containing protein [Luteolibacter sp.]|nr:PDZ domain-containing protein [Luteolibacter sp.]
MASRIQSLILFALGILPLQAQITLEGSLRCSGEQLLKAFEPQREVLQASSALIREGRDEVVYGVVVSAEGHILTKASEFAPLKSPTVTVDRLKFEQVRLLATDPEWDVSLIKVDAQDLVPVSYADSSNLPLGSWVTANGVSSLTKRRLLMGVISARPHEIKPAGGLALGVTLKQEEKGKKRFVVGELNPKGGAAAAGIAQGDILLHVDDKPLTQIEELAKQLESKRAGQRVAVTIERQGKPQTFQVELIPKHQINPPPDRNDQMSGDFSERRSGFPRIVQHSILGNSTVVGGPLINLEGKCIGMNIARANRAESFAIPVEEMKEITARLMEQAAKAPEQPKEPAEPAP